MMADNFTEEGTHSYVVAMSQYGML